MKNLIGSPHMVIECVLTRQECAEKWCATLWAPGLQCSVSPKNYYVLPQKTVIQKIARTTPCTTQKALAQHKKKPHNTLHNTPHNTLHNTSEVFFKVQHSKNLHKLFKLEIDQDPSSLIRKRR